MKSNFMKRAHKYLLLTLLLLNQLLQAQPPVFGDDGDNVQDVQVASIDDFINLMLLVGVIGSFYLLRKKEAAK